MKTRIEVIGGPMDGWQTEIRKTLIIGRDKECDLPLPGDRYISKKHAILRQGPQGLLLEDLGSTNGTFVQDEPVHKAVLLHPEEIFKVGKTLLQITCE